MAWLFIGDRQSDTLYKDFNANSLLIYLLTTLLINMLLILVFILFVNVICFLQCFHLEYYLKGSVEQPVQSFFLFGTANDKALETVLFCMILDFIIRYAVLKLCKVSLAL